MKKMVALFGLTAMGIVAGLFLQSDAATANPDVLARQVEQHEKQIADLEKRIAALEGALKVTAGSAELNTSGVLTLKASLIRLNGGGQPVARSGDSVQVTCPPGGGAAVGKILAGSSSVLSN